MAQAPSLPRASQSDFLRPAASIANRAWQTIATLVYALIVLAGAWIIWSMRG